VSLWLCPYLGEQLASTDLARSVSDLFVDRMRPSLDLQSMADGVEVPEVQRCE